MRLRPVTEAIGPVTRLSEIADAQGTDVLVRAIFAGLEVYDTGPRGPLMADAALAEMLTEARAPGSHAEEGR